MSPSKLTKGLCMAKGQAMDSTRPVDQSWASQSTDLYESKVFLPLTASMMVCMYVHSMEFSRRIGYTYLHNVVLSCCTG